MVIVIIFQRRIPFFHLYCPRIPSSHQHCRRIPSSLQRISCSHEHYYLSYQFRVLISIDLVPYIISTNFRFFVNTVLLSSHKFHVLINTALVLLFSRQFLPFLTPIPCSHYNCLIFFELILCSHQHCLIFFYFLHTNSVPSIFTASILLYSYLS